MLLLAPVNCSLGILFGIRYPVMAMLPLIAAAIFEAVLIESPTGMWSAVWMSAALITCLEVGYLVGAGIRVLFPVSVLQQSWDHLRGQRHSHHA